MSRKLPAACRSRLLLCTLALLLPLSSVGCIGGVVNMMALPYFLMGGDARQAPTGVALVTSKKETKKVLVLSYADFGLRNGFGPIDDELTGLLIGEITKNEERLNVVPERKVREWRDRNSNWVDLTLQEIGEHFKVDYVVFFEVNDFTMSDPKNAYLYQGNTSISFRVHDVKQDAVICQRTYERDFPPNRPVPVSDVKSEEHFRRLFLQRIAQELSWYIVPHEKIDPVSVF